MWEEHLNGPIINRWNVRLMPSKCSLKGTEKRATKNVQLVLQHCCKTRWIAMLHVLPPIFKPVNNLICCKTGFAFLGEKGKDESEKGRELKERNLSPSRLPHLKSPLPYPLRKAWYSGYAMMEQWWSLRLCRGGSRGRVQGVRTPPPWESSWQLVFPQNMQICMICILSSSHYVIT